MSAQVLREAASLLRARAEKATPGPWAAGLDGYDSVLMRTDEPWPEHDALGSLYSQTDAEFIVSMHPGVARALASWLDYFGQMVEEQTTPGTAPFDDYTSALAVARQVLGPDEGSRS